MVEERKKTSLKTRKGKIAYKVKRGRKVQAVDGKGHIVKVVGTKCQIKRAGFPQRVQSKESKDLERLSACGRSRSS